MDWLSTPEAQGSAHYWLATAAGHVLIGAVLWGALAGLSNEFIEAPRRFSAILVALGYAAWEAVQVVSFGGGLLDSAQDAAFVIGGALTAWAAWAHRGGAVALSVAVLAVIGFAGTPRGPHV